MWGGAPAGRAACPGGDRTVALHAPPGGRPISFVRLLIKALNLSYFVLI